MYSMLSLPTPSLLYCIPSMSTRWAMQHLPQLNTLHTTLLSLPTLLLLQVGNAARLAAEEVARLRGALVDLERKNKGALRGTSGSLDSQARIPWQPVGQGEPLGARVVGGGGGAAVGWISGGVEGEGGIPLAACGSV